MTLRRPDEGLTDRQKEILRIVVQEYIASNNPVGSSTVLERGRLGVSSATIRNELALLEELGYVYQPHTSSGRVPTVKGYRYFVEHLMEDVELPAPSRRMIRHQFHQIRLNLDQWLQLTAAVLAHTTRSASLVTAPHAPKARLRHIELISTRDTLFLMILVLQDSSICQEIMAVEEPVTQDQLRQFSNYLNDQLRDKTVEEIRQTLASAPIALTGWNKRVAEWLIARMEEADTRAIDEIYHAGLVHVLEQPEFENVDAFRQLLAIIEQRSLLEQILPRVLSANGVQIIIGGEDPFENLEDVSMVLSPYGIREKARGVLGVVGPRRMPYAIAISTVRYVSQLMGTLIEEVYGHH